MYERVKRTGIMLCYPFERERLEGTSRKAWNLWPVITQPKLDGVRCRLSDFKHRLLLSSTGQVIHSVPHIAELVRVLGLDRILDGELYCHGLDFEDINSIVSRTVNLHEDYKKIEYHVFDYIDSSIKQAQRMIELANWKIPKVVTSIKIVPSKLACSFDQVFDQYQQYLEEGYEGIIVRSIDGTYVERRSTNVMKFKPKKSDSYRIVGYQEEVDKNGEPKGTLGALVCDDTCGGTFNVGSGFTAHQRKTYWKVKDQLVDTWVFIEYQHITKEQKPRFPIFMRLIEPPTDVNEVAIKGED